MSSELKDITISWLEWNRDNGFFNGYMEEDMDFRKVSDEEIEWYFENWVIADIDLEDYDKEIREEIGIMFTI